MSKPANSLPQGAAASTPDGTRRALILPGGGLRLSYAAGALSEIFARGLTFQHMDATSGGALNLAMLFSGISIEEICQRWRTLRMRDTFSPMPLANYLLPSRFMAASASKSFRKKVYPHLGIDFERIRAVEGIQGTFNLCDFSTKTNRVIPHQEMTEDFLVASMSLPATLPPVEVDGVLYLDSGFIQDANLMEAVRRGASELWLIWVMGNVPHYRNGPLNAYVQMLEMSANSALVREMRHISEINERIARGEQPYGHQQPIRLHLIKPRHPLPLDLALYTGAITHDELIEMGRADACDYFAGMTPEGVSLEPETLKMTAQNPGLQFKETMAGGFALGVTEAAQGQAKGKQQNQQLVMHAEVRIDDMTAFVNDPEHRGQLTGSIDFAPLGMDMRASTGVFNLFKPTDDPDMTFMVYELGFRHEGKDYYLAGRKEVRNGPIFRLWPETTTLYTRLHEGTDASGPVIGAGTLSLGVTDLMRLVSTVHVTGTDGLSARLKILCTFFTFFARSLWDTYVRHTRKSATPVNGLPENPIKGSQE